MATFDDFLPEIRTKAYGASDLVAEMYVRSAITEFCEETRIWQRLVQEWGFKGDCRIDFGDIDETNEQIEAVLDGWCNNTPMRPWAAGQQPASLARFAGPNNTGEAEGSPSHFFELPEETSAIGIWPMPEQQYNGTLVFKVALKPTPTATVFDDLFAQRYRRAIIDGALSEIKQVQGQSFSDPGGAAVASSRWRAAKTRARIDRLQGRMVSGNVQVQMVGFGPTRSR